MKKIIEEVEGEGLQSLLGENVTIFCECYIYSGKLVGVNDTDILLSDAHIVYETGELNVSGFTDAQPFKNDQYVRIAKIESYGKSS